ncbi:AAA family ATPase [Serratia liquefaciens]|uniref:AAA family ATPase n=1 Tax=Serratia liquefaciens TaxID=614 RepID=UPI00390578D2
MIIMFGSHKGGVGKTTTVMNIAVMLVAQGRSVIILKADKNKELNYWLERRTEAGLSTIPLQEAYGDISREVTRLAKLSDVVLIDTAGHDSAEFRSALTCANVLISPVRPASQLEVDNLADLTRTVREAQRLANPTLKAGILLTRVTAGNEATELSALLKSDSDWLQPFKTRLSQLKVFESAVNLGAGVHEVDRASSLSKARGQLELLAKEIGL